MGASWCAHSKPATLPEPQHAHTTAIVIFVGGIFALNSPADATRKYKRSAQQYYYYPRTNSACEQRARAEDPTGLYVAYPCWAREALGRTQGGGRGRR